MVRIRSSWSQNQNWTSVTDSKRFCKKMDGYSFAFLLGVLVRSKVHGKNALLMKMKLRLCLCLFGVMAEN